jgi:glyoxylase-like metal-dependent hydrolase (beta-lactamase superfamily II)
MRKYRSGVLVESRYPGVILGAVPSSDGMLLVDMPLKPDDGRDWIGQLTNTGRPKFIALMDHHPDRALGMRSFDLPIVGQDETLRAMRGWPDAFKGSAKPIGAESDTLKRVTGVHKAIPSIAFSDELKLELGDRQVLFLHRPGPTAGSMWVVLPEAKVMFIGDTVTVSEPPYLGDADIEAWIESLEELRKEPFASYMLLSGRDGSVDRDAVNAMARFIRKVPVRLKRLKKKGDPADAAESVAKGLLKDYKLPNARRDLVLLRLQTGLRNLYSRSQG